MKNLGLSVMLVGAMVLASSTDSFAMNRKTVKVDRQATGSIHAGTPRMGSVHAMKRHHMRSARMLAPRRSHERRPGDN